MNADRELLKLAAKAAGIELAAWNDGTEPYSSGVGFILPNNRMWNPLTDDGDALGLVRTLKMTVAFEPSRGGWSVGAVVNGEFAWLAYHDELLDAVVRAAAEIDRRMP